jgi:hypothetical protein
MDDVESINETTCRLLHAPEVDLMAETRHAVPCLFDPDFATPMAEAYDSTIENTLYVSVILFLYVVRRVQAQSVGESQVKNDEDGVPLAAQNKYTSN